VFDQQAAEAWKAFCGAGSANMKKVTYSGNKIEVSFNAK